MVLNLIWSRCTKCIYITNIEASFLGTLSLLDVDGLIYCNNLYQWTRFVALLMLLQMYGVYGKDNIRPLNCKHKSENMKVMKLQCCVLRLGPICYGLSFDKETWYSFVDF